MAILLFILIYFAGLSILLYCYKPLSVLERVVAPILLGLFATAFLMYLMGFVGIPLYLASTMIALIVMTIACTAFKAQEIRPFISSTVDKIKGIKPRFDFVWLGVVGFGTILLYQISLKGLFWPITETDTASGYDLVAKAIASEHTLANSVIKSNELVAACGPRLFYPPFLTTLNSLAYSLGFESPKIINIIIAVSFLALFYALIRRFSGPIAAALCTLLLMITPEMFAHIAFSLTNYPSAAFSSIAIIYMYLFYKKGANEFAILSSLFLAASIMIRSDNVVFILAVVPILAYLIYRKSIKPMVAISYLALPMVVFISWNLFLKFQVGIPQSSFFVKDLSWNGDKFSKVFQTAFGILKNKDLFGLTYIAFASFLVINAYFIFKKDMIAFLVMFFAALIPYTIIYYFIEDEDFLFSPGGGWLYSGYKRGLFSYFPLMWFFVFACQASSTVFKKIETVVFGADEAEFD